tara:strand:+ start:68 stop:880 length:813 start_codon:yes stop_codon:yes gene_type:complete
MKKLFTLSLLALFTMQFSSAQEVGFYPPEGSTYNADSTIVTLPDARVSYMYNDTISFYASETISIDMAGETLELPFVSAIISNVVTPEGMTYDCNIANCEFVANQWGEVTLSGIPTTVVDSFELEITAIVTINATPAGLPMDITFPIPYDGSNNILNLALGDDYSAINSIMPAFILNVTPEIEIGIEELPTLADVVVYPNPATTEVTFEFTACNEATQIQIFDLLGNRVFNNTFSNELVKVNTSNFTNGVYIYKLGTANNSSVGRLIVNK